jgi:hypothetical protein
MNNTDRHPAPRPMIARSHDGSKFELAARRDDRTFTLEGVKSPDTSRNGQRATPRRRTRRFYI